MLRSEHGVKVLLLCVLSDQWGFRYTITRIYIYITYVFIYISFVSCISVSLLGLYMFHFRIHSVFSVNSFMLLFSCYLCFTVQIHAFFRSPFVSYFKKCTDFIVAYVFHLLVFSFVIFDLLSCILISLDVSR